MDFPTAGTEKHDGTTSPMKTGDVSQPKDDEDMDNYLNKHELHRSEVYTVYIYIHTVYIYIHVYIYIYIHIYSIYIYICKNLHIYMYIYIQYVQTNWDITDHVIRGLAPS